MKIYTIVPTAFDYNDEYDYPAGLEAPVKAFKSKDNALAAMKEMEEDSRKNSAVEIEGEDREDVTFFQLEEVELADEDQTSYADFRAASEAAKAKMLAVAKDYFSTASAEVFAKHPTLDAFRLRNCTPYFNDGDTCSFGVGEPYIRMAGAAEDSEDGDYSDGFQSFWKEDGVDPSTWAAYKAVEKLVNSIDEDSFLDMFGDHVCITATRDGKVETEEYDHD